MIKTDEKLEIRYVVIRNESHDGDEYTQILRVCETEENANAYKDKLMKSPLGNKNVTFYVIPTPYGDVKL